MIKCKIIENNHRYGDIIIGMLIYNENSSYVKLFNLNIRDEISENYCDK